MLVGPVSYQCWLTCGDKVSKVLEDGIARNNLVNL